MFGRFDTRSIVTAVTIGLLIFFLKFLPMPHFGLMDAFLFKSLRLAARAGQKFGEIFNLSSAADQTMEEAREASLVKTAELDRLKSENQSLRRALGLAGETKLAVAPVEVLGFERDGRDEFLLIAAGSSQGVHPGALVVDSQNVLAGSVAAVDSRAARVKLLTSPSSTLEVLIIPAASSTTPAEAPIKALARGVNLGELYLDLVPQGASVKKGDLVVAVRQLSSGEVRRFLVGEVREVEANENQVFLPVHAVHLFNPFRPEMAFVLL